MNIKFIELADETKRNNNISSDKLLLEIQMEYINNTIKQTKEKIYNWKGMAFLSKNMLKAQPIILGAATLFGYIFGNISGIFQGLLGGAVVCIPATIIWGITYPISKRKIMGNKGKLRKAEELKAKYEKELTNEKEFTTKRETTIDETISLFQKNKYELFLANEQLETAYSQAIHSKPKKLVLECKTNKRI